jgi:hypothetical protein
MGADSEDDCQARRGEVFPGDVFSVADHGDSPTYSRVRAVVGIWMDELEVESAEAATMVERRLSASHGFADLHKLRLLVKRGSWFGDESGVR